MHWSIFYRKTEEFNENIADFEIKIGFWRPFWIFLNGNNRQSTSNDKNRVIGKNLVNFDILYKLLYEIFSKI